MLPGLTGGTGAPLALPVRENATRPDSAAALAESLLLPVARATALSTIAGRVIGGSCSTGLSSRVMGPFIWTSIGRSDGWSWWMNGI